MKATGIVRRIDDLGRVVIPKEIRRTMRIREGDPLEIYTSREGEVIFKKYSQLGGVETFATDLCDALSRTNGVICAISDRDDIIAVAGGGKRELLGRALSPELGKWMEERKTYQFAGQGSKIPVTDLPDSVTADVMSPILTEGDVLGTVVLIAEDGHVTGEPERKLAQTFATFLGKHMES